MLESKVYTSLKGGIPIGLSLFDTINAALMTLDAMQKKEDLTQGELLNLVSSYSSMTQALLSTYPEVLNSWLAKFPASVVQGFSASESAFGVMKGVGRAAPVFGLVGACIGGYTKSGSGGWGHC